jgi:hypothetical protein
MTPRTIIIVSLALAAFVLGPLALAIITILWVWSPTLLLLKLLVTAIIVEAVLFDFSYMLGDLPEWRDLPVWRPPEDKDKVQ